MVCTFFGHKDTPEITETAIRKAIINLIEKEKADLFYVGNNGQFDYLVHKQLKNLSETYPIKYYIVKAFIDRSEEDFSDNENTIVADGAENILPRFAVFNRNKWMLSQADFVITYVEHISSGAYKFKKLAEKNQKKVIELCEQKIKMHTQ